MKLEYRNPKFETNQIHKDQEQDHRVWVIGILGFEFVSDFDIRISDFRTPIHY